MKNKRWTGLLAFSAMLALVLCMPLASSAKGLNPGVPDGYKIKGPQVHGTILVGWTWKYDEQGESMGTADAYLVVDGHTYFSCLTPTDSALVSLSEFEATAAVNIASWPLPTELCDLYNLGENVTLVKVLEKDVKTDVYMQINTDGSWNTLISIPYHYLLSCEVKITFLEYVGE